jgi:hypothetical protein
MFQSTAISLPLQVPSGPTMWMVPLLLLMQAWMRVVSPPWALAIDAASSPITRTAMTSS